MRAASASFLSCSSLAAASDPALDCGVDLDPEAVEAPGAGRVPGSNAAAVAGLPAALCMGGLGLDLGWTRG